MKYISLVTGMECPKDNVNAYPLELLQSLLGPANSYKRMLGGAVNCRFYEDTQIRDGREIITGKNIVAVYKGKTYPVNFIDMFLCTKKNVAYKFGSKAFIPQKLNTEENEDFTFERVESDTFYLTDINGKRFSLSEERVIPFVNQAMQDGIPLKQLIKELIASLKTKCLIQPDKTILEKLEEASKKKGYDIKEEIVLLALLCLVKGADFKSPEYRLWLYRSKERNIYFEDKTPEEFVGSLIPQSNPIEAKKVIDQIGTPLTEEDTPLTLILERVIGLSRSDDIYEKVIEILEES